MTPIEVLVEEHEKIVRVLDALDGWAEGLDGADDGERPVLRRFMTCIREFVDPIHHGKEEDILFALMVEHGFPKQQGPIAVMLHEHDLARRLIATMHGLAEREAPWSEAERAEAKRAAGSYTELMRQHIDKENGILYPMADARRMNAWIEAVVREHPAQYLWVHKRFKSRPEGEADRYRSHR